MNPQSKWENLRHDIKSKSVSLQTAVGLLQDRPVSEKREILALMSEAAKDILRYVSELEKELGSGV